MEDKKVSEMTLREYYLGIAMQIISPPQERMRNGKIAMDYKRYVTQCNELVNQLMKINK
jgi:hypothetical protein